MVSTLYNYCSYALIGIKEIKEDVQFNLRHHTKKVASAATVLNSVFFLGFRHLSTETNPFTHMQKFAVLTLCLGGSLFVTNIITQPPFINGTDRKKLFNKFKETRTLDKTQQIFENTILVLQSKYDHNGAFDGEHDEYQQFQALEDAGYKIVFKEIITKDEFRDSIAHVTGKAKAIWIRMHGSPSEMCITEKVRFTIDDVEKMELTLKELKGCRIVLYSCSTGAPNGKNRNIKESFEKFGLDVDAPSFPPQGIKIQNLVPLKVGFVQP